MKVTKVIGTKLLVRKLEDKTRTSSGLYIPESAKDNTVMKCKVIMYDPNGLLIDGETRVKDAILMGDAVIARVDHNSSVQVKVEDPSFLEGEYFIIDANNVLCVFEQGE